MTYAQLLARLYGTRRFGVKLGLDRVEKALVRLGDPAAAFGVVVQIGGTNGKGSACAFTEALLTRAGVRTGVFTSPHLSRLAERYRVGGVPADDADVLRAGETVLDALGDADLTFFELATLIGLVVFERAGVEAAVLEVGMGGRLDATTAVRADVTAVTGVALEHQQYLGDTLEAIAREKAGIFRRGVPAVIGQSGEPEAVPVLEQAAGAAGAPIVRAALSPPADWSLGIGGAHQPSNAATALAIAAQTVDLDVAARREALAAARCPGRLEVVAESPRTFVDGAHNPHGARAVAPQVAADVCVIAVSKGKDTAAIVAPFASRARLVIATEAGVDDRGVPAAEVGEAARAATPAPEVEVDPEPRRAIDRARAVARGDVLIVGSLFLAGVARQHLCGDASDPVFLSDPVNLPC
jgi:dihydrofolate synthase/folylpolyglutamate synthase